MNSLVRELLVMATKWALPLVVGIQDIKQAFDSMPHSLIFEALLTRGVSGLTVGLLMRELTAMRAYIT